MVRLRDWRTALAAGILLGLAACAPHDPRAKAVLALRGEAQRGQALYAGACAQCHKQSGGWPLTLAWYKSDGVVSAMIQGVPKTRMPSFAAWPDQQLADVHAYLKTLKN
jgi:mono/diheme cytochrome c family protein